MRKSHDGHTGTVCCYSRELVRLDNVVTLEFTGVNLPDCIVNMIKVLVRIHIASSAGSVGSRTWVVALGPVVVTFGVSVICCLTSIVCPGQVENDLSPLFRFLELDKWLSNDEEK